VASGKKKKVAASASKSSASTGARKVSAGKKASSGKKKVTAGKKASKSAGSVKTVSVKKTDSIKKDKSEKKATSAKKIKSAKKSIPAKKSKSVKKSNSAKKSPGKLRAAPKSGSSSSNVSIESVKKKTSLEDLMSKSVEIIDEKNEDIEPESLIELLTFNIKERHFVIRIDDVVEILGGRKVTLVPMASVFLQGVMTVRGTIVPVIDLAKVFDSDSELKYSEKSKIVVLRGEKGKVGIMLEQPLNIVQMPEGSVLPVPGHLSETVREFLEGIMKIGEEFYLMINIGVILSIPAVGGHYEREA